MRRFTYPFMTLLLISTAPQAYADVVGDFNGSVADIDNSPNTNGGSAITLGASGAIEQVVTANDGGMLAGIELFGVTGPINLGIVPDQGNAFAGDAPQFFTLSPSSGVAVSNGGFFFDASALGLDSIDPGEDFLIYIDLPGNVELLGGVQGSQGSSGGPGFDDLYQCQGGTGFACAGGTLVDLTSDTLLDSLAFEACFVATGDNTDDPFCGSGGGTAPSPPPPPPPSPPSPPPPPPTVPEPTTLSLLGAGLVMAEIARRRSMKKPRC